MVLHFGPSPGTVGKKATHVNVNVCLLIDWRGVANAVNRLAVAD